MTEHLVFLGTASQLQDESVQLHACWPHPPVHTGGSRAAPREVAENEALLRALVSLLGSGQKCSPKKVLIY